MKREKPLKIPDGVLNVLGGWQMEIRGDDDTPIVLKPPNDLRTFCADLKLLYEANNEMALVSRGRRAHEYQGYADDTKAWARRLGCAWARR
jgi:hypothetical protein